MRHMSIQERARAVGLVSAGRSLREGLFSFGIFVVCAYKLFLVSQFCPLQITGGN
jgi:hypothetical protein